MHHRRRTAANPFLQFFGLLVVSVALVFPAAHAAEHVGRDRTIDVDDLGLGDARDRCAAGGIDHREGPARGGGNPPAGKILIKDAIADAFLQQILLRPKEYDVVATLNLNGDYLSDALAAQVGGIGIAPGANINYVTGAAVFEATHGTAPKYAGLDKVNPSSVILSGEMMLRYLGWTEAAESIIAALKKTISEKTVTYDFARLMDGATQVSCSGFGQVMIDHM